jgi:hypothetical protein
MSTNPAADQDLETASQLSTTHSHPIEIELDRDLAVQLVGSDAGRCRRI